MHWEKVPIVCALIKARSNTVGSIPVLLRINEAPLLANSPITLISEYQVREYGLVIDSVAKKHRSGTGSDGQQCLQSSENLAIPFEDRGGLMGFENLPIEDGDEDRYDIIPITGQAEWTPRQFMDEVKPTSAHIVAVDPDGLLGFVTEVQPTSAHIFAVDPDGLMGSEILPLEEVKPNTVHLVDVEPEEDVIVDADYEFHDPADLAKPSYGTTVHLTMSDPDPNASSQDADSVLDTLSYAELLSGDRYHESHVYRASSGNPMQQPLIDEYDILYGVPGDYMDYHAYATTKWHRVIHDKMDPSRLQPYLGGCPL